MFPCKGEHLSQEACNLVKHLCYYFFFCIYYYSKKMGYRVYKLAQRDIKDVFLPCVTVFQRSDIVYNFLTETWTETADVGVFVPWK